MKKTEFPRPDYSIALSVETGCIVMVRTGPRGPEVIGSLDRQASLTFAQSVSVWAPTLSDEPISAAAN